MSIGYSLASYGRMTADHGRCEAYWRALERSVVPGATVLDIGTGSGLMALMACQLGARKVYAVEPNDAIVVAREIAVANSYGERIEFIQDLSTRITLPERVDVIVSDLRGVLPLAENHLTSIADARRRHLAPGGVMIPASDRLWAALVQAPEERASFSGPWEDRSYGLDLSAGRSRALNTWRKARIDPAQLIVEPATWGTLDYTSVESPNLMGSLAWPIQQSTGADGLLVWFDTTLVDGVDFSNAPDQPELIYGAAFMPLLQPLDLAAGDTVSVRLGAHLVSGHYVWQWRTEVRSEGETRPRLRLEQSSFHGASLTLASLRKREQDFRPGLNDEGQVDGQILDQMDGQTALVDIARLMAERFPERFPSLQSALTHCGELSQRYSR